MRQTALFRSLVFMCCFVLLAALFPLPQAEADTPDGQPVSYGLTCSKNGQYVPVFDKAGSNTKTALLNPGEICALDSVTLISKYYWYRVIFIDEYGFPKAGYLKESNLTQLTTSSLAEQMKDPEKAGKIAQLIALDGESPLFLRAEEKADKTDASKEPVMHYVLNTNSKKFHDPECRNANQIKPSNRKDYTGTRTQVINMGYVPCKNCNP